MVLTRAEDAMRNSFRCQEEGVGKRGLRRGLKVVCLVGMREREVVYLQYLVEDSMLL